MLATNNPADLESQLALDRALHPERRDVLQAALQQIFQSAPFRSTRQCQELLTYIVMHTVAGDDLLLRERVIGMEVFGRKPDYDTGEDPVVRLRASDLRKRLAQFYQGEGGHTVPVHISIPSGSYRANFDWHSASPVAETSDLQAAHPEVIATGNPAVEPTKEVRSTFLRQPAGARTLWLTLGFIAAAALITLSVFTFLSWRSSRNSALSQFWGPLLADPHPTLLCLGSNAVYRLSNDFLRTYENKTGQSHEGIEFLITPSPGEKIDERDLLRASNSFVALGDVAAVSDVVSFLAQHRKSFTERFPPDMSFAEIQEYSSVLIGGFNNSMALTITKDLPLVLKGSDRIEERANPQQTWGVQFYGDAHESEDYALISRLVDPVTGREVVTLGGIGQYGTQAAADFLTDPAAMKAWAATMPQGWSRKNLQIVLSVKVVDYRPIKRDVVASRVW